MVERGDNQTRHGISRSRDFSTPRSRLECLTLRAAVEREGIDGLEDEERARGEAAFATLSVVNDTQPSHVRLVSARGGGIPHRSVVNDFQPHVPCQHDRHPLRVWLDRRQYDRRKDSHPPLRTTPNPFDVVTCRRTRPAP